MSALAKARAKLAKAEGKTKKVETLEEKILKLEQPPELSEEERVAVQAAKIAGGDWGPVFVYGQMLSQQCWCALIDRVPDMRPCWLRGYERREVNASTFAALVRNDEDKDMLTVGQAILGLMPWERRLLDEVVDDGFQLVDVIIQPLDDIKTDLEASTYIWRTDKYPEAVGEGDWIQEDFNNDFEEEFRALCTDVYESFKLTMISDDDLKEKALQRRRQQTGFEDEEEFKPEEEEQEDAPAGEGSDHEGHETIA